jgi:16S rRNA (guanine527-N7)-methyltransferase
MLRDENARQNLVSGATLENVWERHILDSAQLVRFEPRPGASWIDIGSGAGLPGIVISCLVQGRVTLLEPRRLRAQFLHKACESLGLAAKVVCSKAERLEGSYEVITARAVANLGDLIELSHHLSTTKTVWALPKGRNARQELAEAEKSWQGEFHVEQSVTEANSWIIIGRGVRAKR